MTENQDGALSPDRNRRFETHNGDLWFVVDTDNSGVHKFGRVVGGPMDSDSAERCAHEMNDHQEGHRYLASQKLNR